MQQSYTILCDDGTTFEFVPIAQGPAHPATSKELQLDAHGLTNVNLHRRTDPQEPVSPEVAPRDYYLNVCGVRSYRTTIKHVHDEDSTTCEIP